MNYAQLFIVGLSSRGKHRSRSFFFFVFEYSNQWYMYISLYHWPRHAFKTLFRCSCM